MSRISWSILMLCVLLFCVLLPFLEFNQTHLFNPDWPAHARLHHAWQVCSNALLSLLALWLAWRRRLIREASLVMLCVAVSFLVVYSLQHTYGGSMLGADGVEKWVAGINVSTIAVKVLMVLSVLLAGLVWTSGREKAGSS